MFDFTLYHCNISYASQKVRLYCYEKNLTWQSKQIDLKHQEQLTTDYYKINPKCYVPAIKTQENQIICGSTAIMIYLEKHYPNTPILLKKNHQKAILDICYQHEALQNPYIKILSYHHLLMPHQKQTPEEIARLLKLADHHPNPAAGAFMRKAIQQGFSQAEIKASEAACFNCISAYEGYLKRHAFICGNSYSLADIVVTATVHRLMQMRYQRWLSSLPGLFEWYQSMQARSNFEKAFRDADQF